MKHACATLCFAGTLLVTSAVCGERKEIDPGVKFNPDKNPIYIRGTVFHESTGFIAALIVSVRPEPLRLRMPDPDGRERLFGATGFNSPNDPDPYFLPIPPASGRRMLQFSGMTMGKPRPPKPDRVVVLHRNECIASGMHIWCLGGWGTPERRGFLWDRMLNPPPDKYKNTYEIFSFLSLIRVDEQGGEHLVWGCRNSDADHGDSVFLARERAEELDAIYAASGKKLLATTWRTWKRTKPAEKAKKKKKVRISVYPFVSEESGFMTLLICNTGSGNVYVSLRSLENLERLCTVIGKRDDKDASPVVYQRAASRSVLRLTRPDGKEDREVSLGPGEGIGKRFPVWTLPCWRELAWGTGKKQATFLFRASAVVMLVGDESGARPEGEVVEESLTLTRRQVEKIEALR